MAARKPFGIRIPRASGSAHGGGVEQGILTARFSILANHSRAMKFGYGVRRYAEDFGQEQRTKGSFERTAASNVSGLGAL